MKAIMLVGGMGTRLQPLTLLYPKPMMPIANLPLLQHTISHLKRNGIEDIILSTLHHSEVFEGYFGDGKSFGVNIMYVVEKEPLGTCGAVKNVEDQLKETFVVLNGDVVTSVDVKRMVDFHKRHKAVGTIYLSPVEDPTIYGLVLITGDGVVEDFLEKPSWDQVTTNLINAGIYVLEPEVLKMVPKNENYSFERGLFPRLLKEGKLLYGFPSSAYWLDIGTPEKYLQVNWDVLEGKYLGAFDQPLNQLDRRIGAGTKIDDTTTLFGTVVIGKNCRIGKNATISTPSVIGSDCTISDNVIIEGSVIMDGCQIGDSCVVKQSIISRNVKLAEKVLVSEKSVIGDNCVINAGNQFRSGIKIFPNTEIPRDTIKF